MTGLYHKCQVTEHLKFGVGTYAPHGRDSETSAARHIRQNVPQYLCLDKIDTVWLT